MRTTEVYRYGAQYADGTRRPGVIFLLVELFKGTFIAYDMKADNK
jgi:hypothetical protein